MAGRIKDIDIRLHVPSPFFNRGPNDGGEYYNYGRLEADTLHHVSAAVHALASASGDPRLARLHVQSARNLLAKLDELIDLFPSNGAQ